MEFLHKSAEKFQVEILTPSDYEEAIQCMCRAFTEPLDEFYSWLCIAKEKRQDIIDVVVPYMMYLTAGTVCKSGIVLGVKSQGKIVGAMFVRLPGRTKTSYWEYIQVFGKHGLIPQYTYMWGWEYVSRFNYLPAIEHTTTRLNSQYKDQYWFIQTFGVLPEARGTGVSSRLMNTILEVADQMGQPVVLETQSLKNEAIYKHYQFETLERSKLGSPSTEQLEIWYMTRPPQLK